MIHSAKYSIISYFESCACRGIPYLHDFISEISRYPKRFDFARLAYLNKATPGGVRMQEAFRERMKQLCESIASERDPERFMELVIKLNELLQKKEGEGTSEAARRIPL